MRLLSIEISGFRGFPKQQRFDTDADAIIVIGANGNGKTSLFDGILWALSGQIPRLSNHDTRLVSMYSEEGQARVVVRLEESTTGRQFTVIRSFDGRECRITLETPDGIYQGPLAEGRLIDLIWPDAASSPDPREALASVLTSSVYLQQDLIRQFVEAATDRERFAVVSELVGVGRITELQASLERAKKAWSTLTNQRQDELLPLRERLAAIEARLSELKTVASQAAPAITPEVWDRWWQAVAALALTVVRVELTSREASSAIDNVIKQLDAFRRSAERRLQVFLLARIDIAGLASRVIPEISPLRDNVGALRKQLEDLKRIVTEEQGRLAELRHSQAALEERTEQLRTLAALALKHLGDHCPVCDQTYDKEATRRRLEAMVKGKTGDIQTTSAQEKLPELLAALTIKEKEATAAELALRTAEQLVQEWQIAQRALTERLDEIGITATDNAGCSAAVEKAIAEIEASIRQMAEVQRNGEGLALRLAQSSALAAVDELGFEIETLRREIADREKVIVARNQTGELAQRIIEALREAASAVVQDRLNEIGPLLQSIYSRMDTHPTFQLVTFLSRVIHGKGQLSTVVSDPIREKECDHPGAVFSSSQVNVLAVAVFLALNIGVLKPPLSVTILDDPLQSLDEINLLGLVDLLRRTKDRRQVFVSTHDGRFGNLLSRKLRPANEKGRTIVIELNTWSHQGPLVKTSEVRNDPVPLRLVASGAV